MVAGFNAGADAYLTKPFDMLELNARVQALLRRTAGRRSSLRSTQPPQPTKESEGLPAKPASQGFIDPPIAPGDSQLQDEFEERTGSMKDFAQLVEAIPRLRKLLEEERQSPQTPRNTAWLGVTDGIIEFLEEIFHGARSLKQHRT